MSRCITGNRFAVTALLAAVLAVAWTPVAASADREHRLSRSIDLPPGFQPEGIEIGPGETFFSGSLVDGAIYRGDLRTGRGGVLVPGGEGRSAFGLELDRRGRLFVAGGPSGGATVIDARTGAQLASYQFTAAGAGLIHDVVVTRRAAYFTDSQQPQLHRVTIGRHGELGGQESVTSIPLSGDLVYHEAGPACPAAPELNATGIETAPRGDRLIVAQLNTSTLYSVDPATGRAEAIDAGARLACPNGMVRRGRALYVTQPPSHRIAVVKVGRGTTAATPIGAITSPGFDFPTAAAVLGRSLYVPNARFATPQTPEAHYRVVRVPARPNA